MTTTPTPTDPSREAFPEVVAKALRRAFNLGETHWRQSDSEYPSQHRKADDTATKFATLVEETRQAALSYASSSAIAVSVPTEAMYEAGMKYLRGKGTAWSVNDLYKAMAAAGGYPPGQDVELSSLKLRRSIERWRNCDPATMATQSPAAVAFAFEDAKHDILALSHR